MLNKALNEAHSAERQSQRYQHRGLISNAINCERTIIKLLNTALGQTSNSLATQSIQLQKRSHTATLNRLMKQKSEEELAREAPHVSVPVDQRINDPRMTSDMPSFGGKCAPLVSTTTSVTSEKDILIVQLQEQIVELKKKLLQSEMDKEVLQKRVEELEKGAVSHEEDLFTLAPLEQPPDYKTFD